MRLVQQVETPLRVPCRLQEYVELQSKSCVTHDVFYKALSE